AVAEDEEAILSSNDGLQLRVGLHAARPLLDPILDRAEGHHAGRRLDHVRGAPLHEAEAMLLREVELEPVAIREGQRGHGRYLAGLDPRGAREGLRDDEGLLLD